MEKIISKRYFFKQKRVAVIVILVVRLTLSFFNSLQFFCQNSRYFLFSEVFTGYRELLSIFSLLCVTIIVLFSCITITRRMLMTLSKSGMNCGSSGEVCTTETRDPLFAFSRSIFLCFSQMQLKFEL